VQFWDLRFGSLLQSFAKHQADVLALVVSPSEHAVYAAGVDSQLIEFRRVSVKEHANAAPLAAGGNADTSAIPNEPLKDKWVLTVAHRIHSHDVRALAVGGAQRTSNSAAGAATVFGFGVVEPEGFILSGGVDTKLVVYSVSRFAQHVPQSLSPFPQRSCVSMAKADRLFLLHHDKTLHLWRLGAPQPGTSACSIFESTLMCC